MSKDFYSTKEVAELTGLTDVAIRQYIRRGQLKASKFDRVYMITQADLEEWQANRVEKPGKRKKAGANNE